jgi:CHAD domain-containing protein
MAVPGRQIEGVTSDALVIDLARAAVEQRLLAVTTCFPQAAQARDEDRERVHHLRVSTRRAAAALRLFRRFYPRRRTKRLLRDLRRVRRAAGRARDLDVFLLRLAAVSDSHHSLIQDLSAERQSAQRELVDLFEQLGASNRLASNVEAVTKRQNPRGKKAKRWSRQTLAEWAPRRLRKAVSTFLSAVPQSLDRVDDLHPMRIAGKQFRYTLELLATGLLNEEHESIYALLEELQDRLGAINDHQWAIRRLESGRFDDKQKNDRLVEQETTAMQDAIAQNQPWFRETFLPRLQDGSR